MDAGFGARVSPSVSLALDVDEKKITCSALGAFFSVIDVFLNCRSIPI
jgi:hypothetical protein